MKNLIAEMARRGYKFHDIAVCIGSSDRTAKNKVNGDTDFTVPEALKVRDELFPDLRMEYLYAG